MKVKPIQKASLAASMLALAAIASSAIAAEPETTGDTPEMAAMPPEQHAGDIAYVTGGVGSAEAKAFEAQIPKHPLAIEVLEKSTKRDEFTGDAMIDISDKSGTTLLSAKSDGPFMLVDLPPGQYTVTASLNGTTLKKNTVLIAQDKTARATFVFPMSTG